MWISTIAVAMGAVIGALLRWQISTHVYGFTTWPYAGTLLVNGLGACGIGCLMAYWQLHSHLPEAYKLFLVTGMMGSLTTFSTFSWEILTMLQKNQWPLALLWIFLHVFGSLSLAALGYWGVWRFAAA